MRAGSLPQPGDAILPARTIVILGTESDLVRLFERGNYGQCLAGGTFFFEPCERVVRGPVEAFDVIAAVSKVGPAQVRKRSRIDEATERLLSPKMRSAARKATLPWQRPGRKRRRQRTGAKTRSLGEQKRESSLCVWPRAYSGRSSALHPESPHTATKCTTTCSEK